MMSDRAMGAGGETRLRRWQKGRMMATAKIVLWRIVGIDLVNEESRLGASLLDGVNPLATYKENTTNK